MTTTDIMTAIHAAPAQWVLALTGGGASAAGALLSVPGGSRTLLEIVVPYSEQALTEFLGCPPDQSCSVATSQAMARRACARAEWLAPGARACGLGCTASLVSERPKRGDHRVHVSTVACEQLRTWSLTLTKGARDRFGEEQVAAGLVLHAMVETLGLPSAPDLVPLLPGERLETVAQNDSLLSATLAKAGAVLVAEDGRVCADVVWDPAQPHVLVPGAFNPLHGGHLALAALAQELEKKPAAYELSVANVDKPELAPAEIRRRLAQFVGRAPVWLTRAPRFVDKARLFPGAVFVLGADTAVRLVAPRYYEHDEERLRQALELFRTLSCRFLVAGRAEARGFLGLEDIPIPAAYRDLFRAIPAEAFRMDISSTQLRGLFGVR